MFRWHVKGVDAAVVVRIPLQLVIVPFLKVEKKIVKHSKEDERVFINYRAIFASAKNNDSDLAFLCHFYSSSFFLLFNNTDSLLILYT